MPEIPMGLETSTPCLIPSPKRMFNPLLDSEPKKRVPDKMVCVCALFFFGGF